MQKALPTSTLQFLAVSHHIALHCALQLSMGPPAGGNEADECICHTAAAATPQPSIDEPVGRVRDNSTFSQFLALVVTD